MQADHNLNKLQSGHYTYRESSFYFVSPMKYKYIFRSQNENGNLADDPSHLFSVAACLSFQWVFFLRNDSRTKKLKKASSLISIQFTQFLRPIKRDFPSQCPTQRPSLLQSRELCSSYYHVHNGVKLFFKYSNTLSQAHLTSVIFDNRHFLIVSENT